MKKMNYLMRAAKITALPFFLLVFFILVSCSNLFGSLNQDKKEPVDSYIRLYDESRTAFPLIKAQDCTYFELTGRNRSSEDGSYTVLGTWNSYEQMLSAKIPVSLGVWDFSLNARAGRTVLSCDKEGYKVALGINGINFSLSVISYSTEGTGNLSLRMSFPTEPEATVKAQLLQTGTLAPVTDEETLAVTHGSNLNSVTYTKNNLSSGSYVIRLNFYGRQGLNLNSYSETAIISENMDTSVTRCLSSINEIYNIRYILNGGSFAEGYVIPSAFTRKSSVILPGGDSISRQQYIFAGWYESPEYQDKPVKSIKKGTAGDIILYAKWVDSLNQVVESNESVNADKQVRISCPDTLEMTLDGSSRKITASLINGGYDQTGEFSFSLDKPGTVCIDAQSANGTAFVSGIKKGYSEITVTHSCGAKKKILVFVAETPEKLSEMTGNNAYLTASDNVSVLRGLEAQKTIRLTAKNLSEYEQGNIQWRCSNPSVLRVIGNGVSATLMPLAYGQSEVTASHPDSLNDFTFYIYINETTITVTDHEGEDNNEIGGTDSPAAISSFTPYYLASSLSTGVTTSASGWSTSPVQPTSSQMYLWTYTRVDYSDGTHTDTQPCIIVTWTESGTGHGPEDPVPPRISCPDTLEMTLDGSTRKITASLVNGGGQTGGFTFTTTGSDIVSLDGQSVNGTAYVSAKKKGFAEITVTHSSGATRNILVFVAETASEVPDLTESSIYFTAADNITVFGSLNDRKTVSITARNLSEYEQGNIQWSSSNTSVIKVIGNGASATLMPLSYGQAEVTASHPDSLNDFTFHAYINAPPSQEGNNGQPSVTSVTPYYLASSLSSGVATSASGWSTAPVQPSSIQRYLWTYSKITYSDGTYTYTEPNVICTWSEPGADPGPEVPVPPRISCPDTLEMTLDGSTRKITASLVNGGGQTGGFTFTTTTTGSDIVSLDGQSANGTAYVSAKKKGFAEITVTHSSGATRNILVFVAETPAKLSEMTLSDAYLTASDNVYVFQGIDSQKTIRLISRNLSEYEQGNIQWTSSNTSVIKVIGNGASATLMPLAYGQAEVTASHPDSLNDLVFYVYINHASSQESGATNTQPSVTSVTPYYLASSLSSGITTSASGWSAAPVQPSSIQKYLWSYTRVNYSDGTHTDTQPRIIVTWTEQDPSGDDPGNTGGGNGLPAGVASMKAYYLTSSLSSGVTVSTSGWSETPAQPTEAKKYLWSFTKVTYTDGTVYNTSPCIIGTWSSSGTSGSSGNPGETGQDGTNGVGITSMKPYYLISSLGSGVTTSTSGWSETPVQPTEAKKYLWSFTRIIYSNGTYTDTVPCVIGTYGSGGAHGTDGTSGQDGSNGINGVNGAGISAMKAYYLISSSMTSITVSTSGWSETSKQPTESLRYLWSYTKVIYTDGTYTNTQPCIIGTWSSSGTSGSTGGGISPGTETSKYLTAQRSYWSIQKGNTITISVASAGISAYEYAAITWTTSDTGIVKILSYNGLSATVKGIGPGTASITVSYPASGNSIKLTVDVSEIPDRNIYISTSAEVMQMTAGSQPSLLQAVLVNSQKDDPSGFSFTIDNSTIAEIVTQTDSGYCYIKPVSPGQAQITVSNSDSPHVKKVVITVGNTEEDIADIVYLTTSSNVVTVNEGSTKAVNVSVMNSKEVVLSGYSWSSSNPAVVSVQGNGATAVLTGNGTGSAVITCTQSSCTYPLTIIAQCVDPRQARQNPYIQLSSNVINITADGTYTNITADLVGGDDGDESGFAWASEDSAICSVFGQNNTGKIKAVSAGTTYITVSHPKAGYPAQVLVICEEPLENDCYISVPSSIISMKPTDGQKTISATLINGSQTDRYNFTWSLDVYNVIDFQYAANVCTITPKQAGSVTITVSHPKAAYDQQIIVNVQQYASFAFPGEYVNITEGTVQFLNMEVPVTNMSTYVRYYLKNSGDEQIVSISGTKNVAQITGVGSGTCTVYADLVATGTGTVQATDDLLVYVKPAPANSVYITSSNTINTIQRGKSQTLRANLTGNGVTQDDQYMLKWTTTDTDVISISGLGSDGSVYGSSIFVNVRNDMSADAHEAVITCTHEKAASALQFYVYVPGSEAKYISLGKNVISLTKGSSGTTLSATIDNADSREDYNNLRWTADKSPDGREIVRLIGSGQTVNIYPVGVGECTVRATLDGAKNEGSCTVIVTAPNSFLFETTETMKVRPATLGDNKQRRNFTVSPPDAQLTFTAQGNNDFFSYTYEREKDSSGNYTGNGYVEVTGLNVGAGTIVCTTDGNARSQFSVNVTAQTSFDIQLPQGTVTVSPVKSGSVGKSFSYSINPARSDLIVVHAEFTGGSNPEDMAQIVQVVPDPESPGTGVITVCPTKEWSSFETLKVYAYDTINRGNIGTKTVSIKSEYPRITPSASYKSRSGNFSKFENGTAVLGDGESMTLAFSIMEENANYEFKSMTYVPDSTASGYAGTISGAFNGATKQFTLSSSLDVTRKVYRIVKAYCPVYYPDSSPGWSARSGTGTKITDLSKIQWFCSKSTFSWAGTNHTCAAGLFYTGGSKNISAYTDGKIKYKTTINISDNSKSSTLISRCIDSRYINFVASYWTEGWNNREIQPNSLPANKILGRNDFFDAVENTSEKGKVYSEEDFQSIAWYWCPQDINDGAGNLFTKGVMTGNVEAVHEVTADTTETKYFHAGDIQYNLVHNGKSQAVNENDSSGFTYVIPVYLSVRECACK